jgi:hypothetical protein
MRVTMGSGVLADTVESSTWCIEVASSICFRANNPVTTRPSSLGAFELRDPPVTIRL